MSKLFSLIRRAPKRFAALVLVLAAVVAVPALSNAWGPIRDTYTIEKPATSVALNSITNNPNIGDERNFVGIREVGSANTWYDTMKVKDGKEYYIRMYVHNNAASNLNLVAKNVTAKFNLPTSTAKSIKVDGFLNTSNMGANKSGNNGKFGEVYDSATFTSDANFNLAYVKNSLKYENNKGTFNLPESIFTSTGAKLGYDKMNGDIPGCFQYAGYVTFKVKPQVAKSLDFTLTKKVSKHGANQWVDNYKAQPGETVDFILNYKNTGSAQNDNVTFRDTLPTGLSYVANSGVWNNARTQNVKFTKDANLTNGTGINVGSYATGANAWIIFSAKVASKDALPCGTTNLVNKAKVNTGGYSIEDDATVTVSKDCPKPVYTCDLLTADKVNRTTFKFTAKATAKDGAKVKDYSFNFGDGKTATQTSNTVQHTYTKDGTYTTKVTVNFTVDGKTVSKTSTNCAVKVTVTPEEKPGVSIDKKVDGVEKKAVVVGEPFTYNLVVKNTGNVDLTNVKVTDNAPAHVEFISADKGTIKDNKWSYTIPSLKVGASASFAIKAKVTTYITSDIKNTACVDAPQVPGNPDDCDDATVTPKKPGVSIDKKVDGVEEKKVDVNQEFTYQLVIKNTGEVDLKNVLVTDNAPTHVTFISADKGTIVNGKWSYTIPELKVGKSISVNIKAKVTEYVAGKIKNTACVDAPQVPGTPDDCDDAYVHVPKKIKVCDLDTKKVITIDEDKFDADKHSKNLEDCAPVTPPELPHTGISEGILSVLGIGSLVASTYYYVASRRGL